MREPGEEPIDSHPNFEDFAGTADSPKNGAVFDEDTGLFEGFGLPGDGEIDLHGVSKYLVEDLTVTVDYLTFSQPSTNFALPRIKKPSVAPGDRGLSFVPSLPDGQNWLQTDFTFAKRGTVFEVFESYRASGRKGWNNVIYPT